MAGADARAAAAMEIFIEQKEISPKRVLLELFNRTIEGTPPVSIATEDADQALLQLQ